MKQRTSNQGFLRRILPSSWVAFPCPLCERPVEVHRNNLGADLRCPHCTAWITAPDPKNGRPSLVRDPRVLEALRFQNEHGRHMSQLERRDFRRPASGAPTPTPAPAPAPPPSPSSPPHADTQSPLPRAASPSRSFRPRPDPARVFQPAEPVAQSPHRPDAAPEWDRDLGTVHRVPAPGFYLSKATKAAWTVTSALVIVAIGMFIFRDLENREEQAQSGRVLQEQIAADHGNREAARLAEAHRAEAPLAAAREALRAREWREALPFIRHAARVEPVMEAYYREHAWTPFELSEISRGRFAETNDRRFYVFEARNGSGKSHALGLEETPTGWKLDWEIFVHLASLEWSRFINLRPSEPQFLRVGAIRRSPTARMLDATRIPGDRSFGVMLYGPDISQGAVYAVLDKQDPLAGKLNELISFDRGRKFILEVAFLPDGDDLVTIRRIVEEGWTYMDDTAPASAPLTVQNSAR